MIQNKVPGSYDMIYEPTRYDPSMIYRKFKTEEQDLKQCSRTESGSGAAAGEYHIFRCSKDKGHEGDHKMDDLIEYY